MIMDELLEFADAVDVSGSAGSALVGDVINLQEARDMGNGQPIYLVVNYPEAVSGGTSIDIQLRSDAAAAISPTTGTLHASTGAVAVASLTAGRTFVFALPLEGLEYEQYLGVTVTRVGTVSTASVNAFLTYDPKGWKSYPDATN